MTFQTKRRLNELEKVTGANKPEPEWDLSKLNKVELIVLEAAAISRDTAKGEDGAAIITPHSLLKHYEGKLPNEDMKSNVIWIDQILKTGLSKAIVTSGKPSLGSSYIGYPECEL